MKPVTSRLPELSDGVMIVVQGTVEKEEDGKFMLDFGHSTKATAALRICVTFASQIVLSVQMAEDNGFSFRRGFLGTGVLRFEVIVLVSDGNFKISLNGCHVCEAPFLIPLKEIDHLEVNGDVMLHRIFCQKPCHADQQVNGDHKASEKVPGTLGVLVPIESELPVGSVVREAQPEKIGESNAPEADLTNQHSAVDLSGGCFNLGLSTGYTPQSGTMAAARGSTLNPSIPGQSEKLCSPIVSESLEVPTTSGHIKLPYAYPSPQTPAEPISTAGPNPPTGNELAPNPLMPNRLGAPYPPAQYTQSPNPVMLDQSKTYSTCPGHMFNQNTEMQGSSNAPYPYPGYPYPQNPVIPGHWNTPYPLPSNTSSQNPVATCQSTVPYPLPSNTSSQNPVATCQSTVPYPLPSNRSSQNPVATCKSAVPLPMAPYQGNTPNLYPPLPSGSDAPYLHSGRDAEHQNPAIPSYGTHPAYNPYYSQPWPNYNQQPGADTMQTLNRTHSNMKFFPEGLRLNQIINIYGEFPQSPSGFSVRLLDGETEDANVFLNMVVSFPDRIVSRNRKMYNMWSQTETSLSHFPFQASKPFRVAIVCCYNLFCVYGNETHLFDFQASMDLSKITSAMVFGMVTSVNIAVN